MGCETFHGQRSSAAQDTAPRDLQMNYLLDTNACIALINGKPSSVRSRFRRAIATGSKVFVSS